MNNLTVDGYRNFKSIWNVNNYYVRLQAVGYGVRYLKRPHRTASEAIAYGNRLVKRYELLLKA